MKNVPICYTTYKAYVVTQGHTRAQKPGVHVQRKAFFNIQL